MHAVLADVMTPAPVTVDVEDSIEGARARMERAGIRHLPVMHREKLVGVVTDRDLAAPEPGAHGLEPTLESCMTSNPYSAQLTDNLASVVEEMARRKIGSAIVLDGDSVAGVFTTIDALSVLAGVLRDQSLHRRSDLSPAEVRKRVLQDHANLRTLIEKLRDAAENVKVGQGSAFPELCSTARDFAGEFKRHLALEDHILRPVLIDMDSFGPVRAEHMDREHAAQRLLMDAMVNDLNGAPNPAEFATQALAVAEIIEKDMEHEEESILDKDFLRDDLVTIAFGG